MPYGFNEGNEEDKDEYFSRPSIQSAEKDLISIAGCRQVEGPLG